MTNDKLLALQHMATMARDLELRHAELTEQTAVIKTSLNELYQKTLPDMLDELGLDRIGIAASGNKPATDYVMRPYYSASIAASWPPEKREAAFQLLARLKADSLIKTEVSAKFPKGQLKAANKLVQAAKDLEVAADLKLSVHSGTLSAWLRELYERGQSLPQSDLEKIGGSVGRIVKAEERNND